MAQARWFAHRQIILFRKALPAISAPVDAAASSHNIRVMAASSDLSETLRRTGNQKGGKPTRATPLPTPTPAGATDAGRQSWYSEGTGLAARPQGTPASGGDECRRIAPLLRRCRAAAQRIWCPRPTSPGTTRCACRPYARRQGSCARLPESQPACRPHRE